MAYLVLANGTVFEGRRIGAHIDRIGELVFTTGMEGYLETLTDPSYYGQIVTQTFPLIGNYGVIEEDFEGNSTLFGYIVRELCDTPSNFRSAYPLNDYLVAKGIPGLCGVDTREIVRITREEGVMNALICDEVPADLSAIRAYTVTNATGMRLDEVHLQLCHLVGTDGDVTQRAETGGDAVDGLVGFGYLPVEVFAAFHDAFTGVIIEFQFEIFGDDLVDEVLGEMR